MPFACLYEAVQGQDSLIGTEWLKQQAIHYSEITAVKEQWSSVMDGTSLRGFYIEGPLGPPVQLQEHEALIVLAREMCVAPGVGKHWRRYVYTKELMHVFDGPDEKAGTEEAFDVQIEKFGDPTADMSPQFRAETKAFWRALAVLCPEKQRREFKKQIEAEEISYEVLATTLRLPAAYVPNLIRDEFETYVQSVLDG